MQIEQVIMTFPEVGQKLPHTFENDGLGDVMRVQVEIRMNISLKICAFYTTFKNNCAKAA